MPRMQVLVLLLLFSSYAAAFDADSYDFGAEKAFKRLCESPKDWFCSALTIEDFTPKRILLLFRGWYELRRGREGELLPLLDEVAGEMRTLKGRPEESQALKVLMENDLDSMLFYLIRLLVIGRSFVLAADLLADLHHDFNSTAPYVLLGKTVSTEFTVVVGVRHIDLISEVIVSDIWSLQPHLATTLFNDRGGKLLKHELDRIKKDREHLRLLSVLFCCPIAEVDSLHLKQLRLTVKSFAKDLEGEDYKAEILAQTDLCYGEDVEVTLKQLKNIRLTDGI